MMHTYPEITSPPLRRRKCYNNPVTDVGAFLFAIKEPPFCERPTSVTRVRQTQGGGFLVDMTKKDRRIYDFEYRAAHLKEKRAYEAAHREEKRVYNSAYAAAHREEKRAYDSMYRAAHKKEIRARDAVYRIGHLEKIRARDAAYHAAHKEDHQAYQIIYQATHRKEQRARNLKAHYGITNVQYDSILSNQGGICAICGCPAINKELAIDHNHVTGKVRGILCSNCNTGLGLFGDSIDLIERAVAYLKTADKA